MPKRVILIGGGVMGCAIALRLAERGHHPLVLERSVPGAEASSAAAGILAPQQEAAGAGPLLDLALRSRDLFPRFIEELEGATHIDVGFRRCGLLALATTLPEVQSLEERVAWQRAAGLRIEPLSPTEARRIEPSLGEFISAVRMPDEAVVDPPQLMRALQIAAAKAGAEFTAAYVRRVVHDGERVSGVEVDGGMIDAEAVVVAAGSWSALVEGSALPPRSVRPLRGQMVELETRPAPFGHVIFYGQGAGGGYLVPRDDGRIAIGSTMEEVGFRKEVTAAGLEKLLGLGRRAVPALRDAPVRRFWAGFRPATDDHLPILGATQIRGLHLATGHFRNGILLTPVTAEAVVATILGDPCTTDLRPFSVERLQRPPAG